MSVNTSIENENGEVLWAPNDFGSYSVEKIQVITEILKTLLQGMVVNVKTDRDDTNTFYSKDESNNIFFRKEDFVSTANELIQQLTDEYLNSKVRDNTVVSGSSLKALDLLSRICYSRTYEELLGTDTSGLSIVPFATSINNLSRQLSSYDTNINYLLSAVFNKNQDNSVNYTSLRLALASTVSTLESNLNTLRNDFSSMDINKYNTVSSSIGTINTNITSLGSRVTELETAMNNLNKNNGTIAGINSEITSLKNRASSLESRTQILEGKVLTLEGYHRSTTP